MNTVQKIKIGILVALLFAAGISIYAALMENRRGELTVAFLDVGQGDSIFIEAPNGNQMLIDGGLGKSVLRELSKVMPFYDRNIDVVLMSHPDEDHIGGLPDVLEKYKVGLFVEPGVAGESSAYEEIEKTISALSAKNNFSINRILARRGMVVDLGGGAVLQILYPVGDVSKLETNTASIVARLIYGENEFLMTGDSPKNIEEYLLSLESKQNCQNHNADISNSGMATTSTCFSLKSDVLKVSHHGSKNSTDEDFVKAVSLEYAVISVGKDNRYGHPASEVLNILQNFGAEILRTDEQGRIILESDGKNIKIK